jgi:hypothetical protein
VNAKTPGTPRESAKGHNGFLVFGFFVAGFLVASFRMRRDQILDAKSRSYEEDEGTFRVLRFFATSRQNASREMQISAPLLYHF